jgi:hypothetical protein
MSGVHATRAQAEARVSQFKGREILAIMSLIHDALRASHAPGPSRRAAGPRVLVAGGAGVLGSALLEQLLGERHFAQVSVLASRPLQTALRGLNTVLWTPEANPALERSAVIVFDRGRGPTAAKRRSSNPCPTDCPRSPPGCRRAACATCWW